MNNLKIKICGMRDPANITGVVAGSSPDYLGFIFYPRSKRFAGFRPLPEVLAVVPDSVKKVGVFVDETPETVLEVIEQWNLEAVQLHGKESPDYCHRLKISGMVVIKAFSVDETFDFSTLEGYSQSCDFFLFDTKGLLPGGTGNKFNWQLLSNYQGDKPFFLSGGIGPDDWKAISELSHPQLLGIDINSGFEISPGWKDVESIRKFIREIRQ